MGKSHYWTVFLISLLGNKVVLQNSKLIWWALCLRTNPWNCQIFPHLWVLNLWKIPKPVFHGGKNCVIHLFSELLFLWNKFLLPWDRQNFLQQSLQVIISSVVRKFVFIYFPYTGLLLWCVCFFLHLPNAMPIELCKPPPPPA